VKVHSEYVRSLSYDALQRLWAGEGDLKLGAAVFKLQSESFLAKKQILIFLG